jgi:hypothetical protein
LEVEIVPFEKIDTTRIFPFFNNISKIKQTLNLKNYSKDTIYLPLENPSQFSFMNPFLFQHIKVTAVKNKKKREIPSVFQNNMLQFLLSEKDEIVEIDYYYQTDYFMKGHEYITCYFCPTQHSWFSWYFSVPNMIIEKVSFSVPDNTYLLANLPQQKKSSYVELQCDTIPPHGISYFLMEKRHYDKIPTTIHNNQYNLYLFKDIIATGDSSSLEAFCLSDNKNTPEVIEKRISSLERGLKGIHKLFNQQIDVDIVDACLDLSQGGNKIYWGSAFMSSDNHGLVVMDTSFWNTHSCTHELVHFHNRILPNKDDSSYYFFHESMTEFLSVQFFYSDVVLKDSVYQEKILKYVHIENDCHSIFDVTKNEVGLDLSGSYGVIYLKTPFVLHCLEKKIGEEKFMKILSSFYRRVKESGNISFSLMEQVFKESGISDAVWEWFLENL